MISCGISFSTRVYCEKIEAEDDESTGNPLIYVFTVGGGARATEHRRLHFRKIKVKNSRTA
jgi:hypothetical protein